MRFRLAITNELKPLVNPQLRMGLRHGLVERHLQPREVRSESLGGLARRGSGSASGDRLCAAADGHLDDTSRAALVVARGSRLDRLFSGADGSQRAGTGTAVFQFQALGVDHSGERCFGPGHVGHCPRAWDIPSSVRITAADSALADLCLLGLSAGIHSAMLLLPGVGSAAWNAARSRSCRHPVCNRAPAEPGAHGGDAGDGAVLRGGVRAVQEPVCAGIRSRDPRTGAGRFRPR